MKLEFRGKEYHRRLTVGALIAIQEAGIDLEDITGPDRATHLVTSLLSISGIGSIAHALFKKDLKNISKEEFLDELTAEQVASLREQLIDELTVFFTEGGRPDLAAFLGIVQKTSKDIAQTLETEAASISVQSSTSA